MLGYLAKQMRAQKHAKVSTVDDQFTLKDVECASEELSSRQKSSDAPVVNAKEADDAPWLSISAFARRYGVDRGTVHKWLNQKLLDHYRVGLIVRVKNIPPDQHCQPAPVDKCG